MFEPRFPAVPAGSGPASVSDQIDHDDDDVAAETQRVLDNALTVTDTFIRLHLGSCDRHRVSVRAPIAV